MISEEAHSEHDSPRTTRMPSLSALAFFVVLGGLFVAATNFVGVNNRDEAATHTAGGIGHDPHEANEHSTPNDPAVHYKYTPAAGNPDTSATRP